MNGTTDNLTQTLDAFTAARGVGADEEWAGTVAMRLLVQDVDHSLVRSGLEEALSVVRQSQESPEELFGDPHLWADARLEQWRQEGAPVAPLEPDSSWRILPAVTMVTAAVISVILLVVLAVQREWTFDYTWGAVLLPTISALSTVGALTVFEKLLERTRRLLAGAVALLVVAAGVLTLTALFMLGNDHPIGQGGLWWLAVLALGHAVLAWVFAKVIPDAPARHADDPTQDEEWLRQVAGILRLRAEMPEKRVQQHLTEARTHAEQTGRPLLQEFGTPSSYASRFPRDQASAERRTLWLYTAVTPIAAVLALGDAVADGWDPAGISWPWVIVFVLAGAAAVSGWWRVLRSG